MLEPVLLNFIKTGLRGASAGNGHEIRVLGGEARCMLLNEHTDATPEAIAIVSFARFAGGNEPNFESGRGAITQKANNDKPACFRLTGCSCTGKFSPLIHAVSPRQTHNVASSCGEARSTLVECVLLSVALVLKLYTFWQEALTAFLTAATQDVTTCFGSHAGTESELAAAGTLGGLVSAKAHGCKMVLCEK